MARSVRFHPQADQEAEGAVQWYRERSLMAAAGFVAELSHVIQKVAESPETMAAPHSEHKAVHLSRLSLQPYLPSHATRSHCRRSRAREAENRDIGNPGKTSRRRSAPAFCFKSWWATLTAEPAVNVTRCDVIAVESGTLAADGQPAPGGSSAPGVFFFTSGFFPP